MHEFIDECYSLILTQVTSDKPLNRRIAALYLLYGMYMKQPLDEQLKNKLDVKIRLNFNHLAALRELFNQCNAQKIYQPCYIWYRLLAFKAYHFVFHEKQNFGPHYSRHNTADQSSSNAIGVWMDELQTEVAEKVDGFHELADYYHLMREEVVEQTEAELGVKTPARPFHHDLIESIRNKMARLLNNYAVSLQSEEVAKGEIAVGEVSVERASNANKEQKEVRKQKSKVEVKGSSDKLESSKATTARRGARRGGRRRKANEAVESEVDVETNEAKGSKETKGSNEKETKKGKRKKKTNSKAESSESKPSKSEKAKATKKPQSENVESESKKAGSKVMKEVKKVKAENDDAVGGRVVVDHLGIYGELKRMSEAPKRRRGGRKKPAKKAKVAAANIKQEKD